MKNRLYQIIALLSAAVLSVGFVSGAWALLRYPLPDICTPAQVWEHIGNVLIVPLTYFLLGLLAVRRVFSLPTLWEKCGLWLTAIVSGLTAVFKVFYFVTELITALRALDAADTMLNYQRYLINMLLTNSDMYHSLLMLLVCLLCVFALLRMPRVRLALWIVLLVIVGWQTVLMGIAFINRLSLMAPSSGLTVDPFVSGVARGLVVGFVTFVAFVGKEKKQLTEAL